MTMAMLIELWGDKVLALGPEEFKAMILSLPPTWWERKTYLMHEYQNLKPHQWESKDYADIGVTHNI